MAKKQKTTVIAKCYATTAWVLVLSLWGAVGCTWLNPAHFRFLGVVGLAFPFFVLSVLCIFVLGLLFFRRQCWIPLLGLALCFVPIRHYCPINLPSPAPKGCLKVMTYNTLDLGSKRKDDDGRLKVLTHIAKSGVEVAAIQEAYSITKALFEEDVRQQSAGRLQHFDTIRLGMNVIGCFSKYPIVGKKKLCEHNMNGAGVFYLLLGHSDTLYLVNCHLESMGLSDDDRNSYHEMLKNPDSLSVDSSIWNIATKIANASVHRAQQADSIQKYIERNADKNLIVCGDFNDSPISYVHNQLTKMGLTDAHSASATGIGRTFNRNGIYVRIDHLLCSSHWKPYNCKIDRSIIHSDHYPLICYLKREN